MKKASRLTYFATTLIFFLFVDFYFSNLIVSKLSNGRTFSNELMNLVYIKNTGAAFSIMQDSTIALVIFSLIAIVFMLYFIAKNLDSLRMKEFFCISLLMSGILGNMYERIHFGYVRDFFELAFVNFPVFNISDVFINLGVFAIIILIVLTKKPIRFL